MKELIFKRAHYDLNGVFLKLTEWGFMMGSFVSPASISGEDRKQAIDVQYSEIDDKKGNKIFEGSIVRFREPYRSTQTHYGDNIPNGAYTEPMEPAIRTLISEVIFKAGCFTVNFDRLNGWHDQEDIELPLCWMIQQYDAEGIKESIAVRKPSWDIWDSPEEGNLQYLLETYNLSSEEELIDYCSGIEVIGNIYENPELL